MADGTAPSVSLFAPQLDSHILLLLLLLLVYQKTPLWTEQKETKRGGEESRPHTRPPLSDGTYSFW